MSPTLALTVTGSPSLFTKVTEILEKEVDQKPLRIDKINKTYIFFWKIDWLWQNALRSSFCINKMLGRLRLICSFNKGKVLSGISFNLLKTRCILNNTSKEEL